MVSRSRGSPGWRRDGGTGSAVLTWAIVSKADAPRNGGRPVSSVYRMAPRAYTSVAATRPRAMRHVARRAENGPRAGQVAIGVKNLRQPEIGDLGRSVGVEQHVGRLEIAVDDPLVVRLRDRAGQRLDESDRFGGRPRRSVERPVKVAAVDVLQLEIGEAVNLANVVDLHNIRVRATGRQPPPRPGNGWPPRARRGAAQDHL